MEGKNNNNGQNEPMSNSLQKWEESFYKSFPRDLYVFKKTEKICSAIHFVTKLFDDKEPLRMTLREKSINAVSQALSFISNTDLMNLSSTLSLSLIEIRSLLQTAYFIGLITEMNFNIVKDEVDKLLAIIESKRQTSFTLPASFLEVPVPDPGPESIGHYKGQSIGQSSKMSFYPLKSTSNVPKSSSPVNSDRTIKIVSLLKDGRELTIKDFSISIKGCSEKTLQRELLRLVSEGKVIKTGERRWSRYSLK